MQLVGKAGPVGKGEAKGPLDKDRSASEGEFGLPIELEELLSLDKDVVPVGLLDKN